MSSKMLQYSEGTQVSFSEYGGNNRTKISAFEVLLQHSFNFSFSIGFSEIKTKVLFGWEEDIMGDGR